MTARLDLVSLSKVSEAFTVLSIFICLAIYEAKWLKVVYFPLKRPKVGTTAVNPSNFAPALSSFLADWRGKSVARGTDMTGVEEWCGGRDEIFR